MDTYKIEWKNSARKELKKINKRDIPKILNQVESLIENPFPSNHKKYLGTEHTYRIRVQNYRVIYSVLSEILTIEVIKIGHRKDVYRD